MTEPTKNSDNSLTENPDNSLMASLKRLAALVSENALSELMVEENGVTVTLKAAPEPGLGVMPLSVTAHPHVLTAAQSPADSQTAVTTTVDAPKLSRASTAVALESPMVGVFYLSPSPADPPYVAVGDRVTLGQTIGLIEAMKVYSEVPSEIAGRVVELPVESGKLVQQGQALIYVEPS